MPLRKESEKVKEKREAGIAKVLEAAGARVKDISWRVEWVLKTSVGDLLIVPYERWVHCRFQDSLAAREARIGSGQTGKWNWHGSDFTDWSGRVQGLHVQQIIDRLRCYKLI